MTDQSSAQKLLVTPRQKALFKILTESGLTEDGTDALGEPIVDGPPYGITMIVDMTLSSHPSEDELVDVLTWGDRSSWDEVRPLARKILTLIHEDDSSAA
jgi:hypothetical protein